MHTLLPLAVGIVAGVLIGISFSRALVASLLGELKGAQMESDRNRKEALYFTGQYRKIQQEFLEFRQAIRVAEKVGNTFPRLIDAKEVERV